jgi:DNA-binding LacI/PurR family transcriptional regulator
MRQAFELSLDLSGDLSVIEYDDIRLAQFMIPPLTTVQMSQAEIAETALTALLEYVKRGVRSLERGGKNIKTEIVLRRSTAPASPS